MDKRYQVFVSSTYEDLVEERLEVMKALLELDCIPCGMEYFPAANEDQWTFIRKLIDSCDYYVLIMGGRYGSEDEDGKSYTQKEYEYALSKGIPTIGFIYPDRTSLAEKKRDSDPNKIQKLEAFISLVRSKLCKDWHNAYELGAVVSRSLTQLINNSPRTGWVRADKVGSEELLEKVNKLLEENQELKEQVTRLEASSETDTSSIAFEEKTNISGTYEIGVYGQCVRKDWGVTISWKDLFLMISPYMLEWCNEQTIGDHIARAVLKSQNISGPMNPKVDDDILQTIKVQFLALNLINSTVGRTGVGIFWSLTPKGKKLMLVGRSIKKNKDGNSSLLPSE